MTPPTIPAGLIDPRVDVRLALWYLRAIDARIEREGLTTGAISALEGCVRDLDATLDAVRPRPEPPARGRELLDRHLRPLETVALCGATVCSVLALMLVLSLASVDVAGWLR